MFALRTPCCLPELLALLLLAGLLPAADTYWVGRGGDANWTTAANWASTSGGSETVSVPGATHNVYFDGSVAGGASGNKACTVNCPSDAEGTVVSWTQSAGYTSTVTFNTTYSGAFQTFTITGDCTVAGGKWTHTGNTTTQTSRLKVAVGGNFTLTSALGIDVTGKGFSAQYGPGSLGNDGFTRGGSYGGVGGVGASTDSVGVTYGNPTAPVDLGSGGSEWGGYAGGAIHLTVTGALQVGGPILSTGLHTQNVGSSSGGSIFITAGTISGAGLINANGGDPVWNGKPSGGGGRIAIILTTGGADFSALSTTPTALSGDNREAWSRREGAAGTIYLETTANGAGGGSLLIANGDRGCQSQVVTSIPAGASWSVGRVTVTSTGGYGVLQIPSGCSLTTTGTGTTVTIGTTATLNNLGMLTVGGTAPSIGGTITCTYPGNTVTYTGQTGNAGVTIINCDYANLTVNRSGTTFTTPDGTGSILREVWTGIGGSLVSDLVTGTSNFTTTPNSTSLLTSFDAPVDVADSYGARIRGYVMPPQTGNYTFWIASDDDSQLYLSTDATEANKALIASVSGYTSHNEWTKYGSQQSSAIALVAGQRYYIEARHKENSGGDNCSVGWQLPDASFNRPISGAYLAPLVTPATIVSGNFTITAGTFASAGNNLKVAGNWANSGTYTPGSNTVTLNGAGGSTQVLSGTTTFNNLTATCTSARTLKFQAGTTQTVTGTMTFTGASGQLLTLASGTPTSTWTVNPSGWLCSYVSVTDSTNQNVSYITPANSTNGGNTVGWFFPATANYWLADAGDVWSNTAKWSLGHVPSSSEVATFTSAHVGTCTYDLNNQVVGSIVFATGYSGTFALGTNLLEVANSDADFSGLTTLTGTTGTVRFSSGATQIFTPNGLSYRAITHTGSGTLQLAANLSCVSLVNSAGTLNVNGKNITTSGAMSVTNGTTTFANLGGSVFTIGGNATFTGQAGNLLNMNPGIAGALWTLTVTGSLTGSYATIYKSDASAGSIGTASNCVDAGRNQNWNFGSSTWYWHPTPSSTDVNHASNWTANQNGTGAHPVSTQDDPFVIAALDTNVWTYRDNVSDGFSSASLTTNPGRLTLTARGSDVWNSTYRYAGIWRSDMTGNAFDVSVHVASQTNTDGWAKAGIMVMNDVTSPAAGGVGLVAITPGNNAAAQFTSSSNDYIDSYSNAGSLTAPCYLRMKRSGTTFTGFYKKNLTDSWSQISQFTPAGAASGTNSQILLFNTAHNSGSTCTVVMDSFQAGSTLSAKDQALSFNGSGTGNHGNATMSANQTAASIDVTGANGYNGTFDFNNKTLSLTGNANYNQSLMTVAATGGGTIAFTGTAAQTFTPKSGGTFPSLLQNGSGGTTLSTNALTLSGNLTLTSGTLNANGLAMSVAGNWANNSTFTATGNTVTLNGAGGSTQVISGTTTFNIFTATCATGRTLEFAAGSTQTISGDLTLTGAASNRLRLRSSIPGSAWRVDPQGARSCAYVDIRDGNNLRLPLILPTTSVDSGGTTWWFGQTLALCWDGATSGAIEGQTSPVGWTLGSLALGEVRTSVSGVDAARVFAVRNVGDQPAQIMATASSTGWTIAPAPGVEQATVAIAPAATFTSLDTTTSPAGVLLQSNLTAGSSQFFRVQIGAPLATVQGGSAQTLTITLNASPPP